MRTSFIFASSLALAVLSGCKANTDAGDMVENAAASVDSAPLPSHAVVTREGVVLRDNVGAFEEENPRAGTTPTSTFNSGDIVSINDIERVDGKEEADKVAYRITADNKTLWISAADVYLPVSQWFIANFQGFQTSTHLPWDEGANNDSEKMQILKSADFYRRATHNPNPEARAAAYGKLPWLSNDAKTILEDMAPAFRENDSRAMAAAMSSFESWAYDNTATNPKLVIAVLDAAIPKVTASYAEGLIARRDAAKATLSQNRP